MNKIFTKAQTELIHETDIRKSVIQTQTNQLLKIRKTVDIVPSNNHNDDDDDQSKNNKFNDWDIDYEE